MKERFWYVFYKGVFALFVFGLSACGPQNHSAAPTESLHNPSDIDFSWDIWPEAEENQTLVSEKLSHWSSIPENAILFLGDESLQGNWGLLLEKNFTSASKKSYFLSACLSAQTFKSGGQSLCGLWTKPFVQQTTESIFMTLDQTSKTERLAPRLLVESNVKEVVISFGQRIAQLSDSTQIQKELSAIELLAKWSHGAGKKCYVIEPVGAFFMESEQDGPKLTDRQKDLLRVSIEPYCHWVDATKLKSEFTSQTNIDLESIRSNHATDEDMFVIPQPKVELLDPQATGKDIEIPEPQSVLEDSTIDMGPTADELLAEKRKDLEEDALEPLVPEEETKEVDSQSGALLTSPRPKARPERISPAAQEEIRQRIEGTSSEPAIQTSTELEPKYHWNGYTNGDKLTEIGKQFLSDAEVGKFLVDTQKLRDVEKFCPKYWELDEQGRKYFWLYLFSSVARFENHTFNPQALHLEKASMKHSIGIFQVDTTNCGYGADSNKHKLYDEAANFRCAFKLAVRYVKNGVSSRNPKGGGQVADGRYNGSPGQSTYVDAGMDYYWSVLRQNYKGYAYNSSRKTHVLVVLGKRNEIQAFTRNTELCSK